MAETDHVAVLIDCDNISWQLAKAVIAEAAKHGTLSVKRAYGDFSSDYLRNWRPVLPRLAIQPIQQSSFTVGKNSTDAALIIDAMDLLHAGNVDAFCIVSSDSDFTRLAMRLRESGRRVHGIGGRQTPVSFRMACDLFTFTEALTGQSPENVAEDPAPRRPRSTATTGIPPGDSAAEPPTVPEIAELMVPAVRDCGQDDGWADLSRIGEYLVTNEPSFDSRNYGHARLGKLVGALPFLEVKDVPDRNDLPQRWVRVREVLSAQVTSDGRPPGES